MKKLLLSCDTGIDDALALAYAAGQTDMEFLGVCTTYGVAKVQNTYRNSRYILNLLGSNANVWMGSDRPLVRPMLDYDHKDSIFHGRDGLGGILPQATDAEVAGAQVMQGVDVMLEMAQQYGQNLIIVTTGPLTDLARALQKDPALPQKVGRVVSMGGALAAPGNSSPYSEANVWMDPEAAKLVLESDLPLTLIGLDVTRKTLLCQADLNRWQSIPTPAAQTFCKSVGSYLAAYAKRYPYLAGCALHDPLAVGVALHPEWVTTLPMHLTCVTSGEADGRTLEDMDRIADTKYTTQGAFLVDAKAFEADFYHTVETIMKGANS